MIITDGLAIRGQFSILKAMTRKSGKIDWELIDQFFNNVVNVGGALIADRLIGVTATSFATSYIGVGDNAAAVAIGQTDLQASTNKLRKVCDATFPSRSGQIVTWECTFGTSEANWQWNEMAVFNASSGATMLCRGLPTAPITKTSGASLKARYQCTFPASY